MGWRLNRHKRHIRRELMRRELNEAGSLLAGSLMGDDIIAFTGK